MKSSLLFLFFFISGWSQISQKFGDAVVKMKASVASVVVHFQRVLFVCVCVSVALMFQVRCKKREIHSRGEGKIK